DRFRRGAGHVEGRSIVSGFGVSVGGKEGEAAAEAFFQAGFQGVVVGIGDTGDEARRRKFASGWRVGERASRVAAALVGVVRRGDARDVNRRIAFVEGRGFGSLCT